MKTIEKLLSLLRYLHFFRNSWKKKKLGRLKAYNAGIHTIDFEREKLKFLIIIRTYYWQAKMQLKKKYIYTFSLLPSQILATCICGDL